MIEATVSVAKCLVDDEGCARNVASALSRGLPVVTRQQPKPGRLAIVASGPSTADHLDELRAWPGEIWAVNGAFCWLHEQGIEPDAFVALDPGKGMEHLLPWKPEATYYIAAKCDPDLFDHLSDRDVKIWCSIHNDIQYPKDAALVTGGTTCLTRAPWLAHVEGWRDITIFGADCSFREGMYCYDPANYACSEAPRVVRVRVGGEVFDTNEQMVRQVAFFGALDADAEKVLPNTNLKFRCGGLLEAWLAQPIVQVREAQGQQETING